MADAIVDHRASLEYETRSVYGRIVSSTDREISIDNDRNEFMKKELEVIKKYNLELPNNLLFGVGKHFKGKSLVDKNIYRIEEG